MAASRPAPSTVRSLLTARPVLLLFAFLSLTNLLPTLVDIYALPVVRWVYVPSYVVSLFVYEGFGLENAVYAIEDVLSVESYLLWQLGKFVTFYLVSVVFGGAVTVFRGGGRAQDGNGLDG